MKPLDRTLTETGTTIFETVSRLSRESGAVNLGQGFPDDQGPLELREAAARFIVDGNNQYPPMMGVPELRQAVARHHRRWYGIDIDWENEVLVTSGATEALMSAFMAILSPGDEVILLEPAYDTYAPVIRRLGAVPLAVRLEPPTWQLPRAALEAVFSNRTKLLVLNSPMNPTGRVLSLEELGWIAPLLNAYDVYAICDEVYEHLIFDGVLHVPLLALPLMRERCVRIGSAGKTFSLTGWKVGYATGSSPLIRAMAKAHQLTTFTTPPNLQHAVALGLDFPNSYFAGLASSMQRSRDRLHQGLVDLGVVVHPSQGTYFLVADVSRWMHADESDVGFCERLISDVGVAAIPMSAFYDKAPPRGLVRFCFSKSDATIDAALDRLRTWRQPLRLVR